MNKKQKHTAPRTVITLTRGTSTTIGSRIHSTAKQKEIRVVDADGRTVAFNVPNHNEANLIAAAPTVLEALIDLSREATEGKIDAKTLQAAFDAIAKAKS